MEIVIQILFNSIVSGLLLSLVAVGFTYVFRITRVFHLAQGAIYSISGLIVWNLYQMTNSFVFSGLISLFIILFLIYLTEKGVYLPLSDKGAQQNISLISSMAVYTILVNFASIIWGNENKVFMSFNNKSISFFGIIITQIQMIQYVISTITLISFQLIMQRNNLLLSFRAMADNEQTSQIFGLDKNRIRLIALVLGSTLVLIASVLKGIEVGVEPHNGLHITLTASVICILISRLNLIYIIIASIILTLLQGAIEWFLNAQWKESITFLILLIVILFKTDGLISYNLRKDKR